MIRNVSINCLSSRKTSAKRLFEVKFRSTFLQPSLPVDAWNIYLNFKGFDNNFQFLFQSICDRLTSACNNLNGLLPRVKGVSLVIDFYDLLVHVQSFGIKLKLVHKTFKLVN